MKTSENTAESGPVALIRHSLGATVRALTPLLLAMAAVWTLLLGIGADRVTLAQGENAAISAEPLAPRPVVVSTIPVPLPSPLSQAAIAINPATGYAYVLSHAQYTYPSAGANLMIISGTGVVASSTSPDYGAALAVDPNQGHVYMPVDGGVAIISGTEVIEVIPVDPTLTGRSIGVAPSTNHIYVDGYDWGAICIPETPWCGGMVWILVDGWNTRLDVGGRVETIGLNPVTGFAYATYRNRGLWEIKRTVVIHRTEAIAEVPPFGEAIGINPDSGYVYITEAEQNRAFVLSGTQVLRTLTTGLEPRAIGLNPGTGYVYIANTGSNSVTVISATEVITTLTVGAAPGSIGVNLESGYVYVANADDNTLSVINDTQVMWTLPSGRSPGAVGVNSDAGYVYVVNYEDASVSVIREMILPHRVHLPLVVKP